MTTTNKQEPLGLDNLRNLIADDSYAATFQSFGQYRSALLKEFDQRAASSDDLVVEANRQLLLERGRIGIQKYGTTLASAGLSRTQLAQHALEEALDLANYLQTIIQTEARASQQAGAAVAGDAWHMSFSDDGSLLLKRGGNELRFVPAPTDTGAAGASEVKAWQERTSIPMPEPHEMLFSMRQIHAAKDAEIVDLRAQLARQQAPVGDSVDTPEFADRIAAWAVCAHSSDYRARTDGARKAWTALITHITAWKDAQLARERQGQGGMHAAADYIDKKAEEYIRDYADNEHDTGAVVWRYGAAGHDYHSSLVELAEELRAATPAAQAQGEPVAWQQKLASGDWTWVPDDRVDAVRAHGVEMRALGVLGPAPQADECRLLCEKLDISIRSGVTPMSAIACHIADLKYEAKKAAPQADEVRDAALEEAAKVVEAYAPSGGCKNYATAIRALKRTTAADNQTKGE